MISITSITSERHTSSPARRSQGASIALWSVQIALAAMFLLAGSSKLAGAPAMVALFDAIGVGQWFRHLTGLIEVLSAVALLVPSVAAFGAVALAATMAFIVSGPVAPPAVLLLGSLVIAWARRDRLFGILSGAR